MSDKTNGLNKDRMGVALLLQNIAQTVAESDPNCEAVIIISINDASVVEVADGHTVVADIQLGQSATTEHAAAYCAALREVLAASGLAPLDDGFARAEWD